MTSTENITLAIKGPHARRRFLKHLAKVQQLLQEADALNQDVSPAQILFQSNTRAPMFMLQGLARVYGKLDLDDKLFARIRLESKIVEDALGLIDFWTALTKQCQAWSLPAGVAQLARERTIDATGRAWAWIQSQDWIACRYHDGNDLLPVKFAKKLKAVDWLSPAKEAKALRKWLMKDLKSLHHTILELDLTHIEDGLHEARREVRWISIYFGAMEGAFVLDKEAAPPEDWERYLTPAIINNPFNQLPEPEADDVPIIIPAPLLYALSYLIEQLGIIKDSAQWTETVRHLLHLTGEKPSRSLPELMGDNYLEPEKATERGAALIEQVIVHDELLLKLAEAIRL